MDDSLIRFRLIPADRGHFQSTHYVRSVRLAGLREAAEQVPANVTLEAAIDIAEGEAAEVAPTDAAAAPLTVATPAAQTDEVTVDATADPVAADVAAAGESPAPSAR